MEVVKKMKKLLTGLKPTGDLTLGNYIGAIIPMRKKQEEYESYLFVADLHALTVKQDPQMLKQRIRSFIAMYIACGIDPDKNIIYIQSENEYIPCISWLIESSTYYGEASRMIQFKEKTKNNKNFNVSLLTYPMLMAADILFVDSDFVPVGIDQKQHVELARDIAERFNNTFGSTFTLPEPLIEKVGTKIKDLKDPSKKMSKSEENPNGVISLFDTEDQIRKKIMGATTDSETIVRYDPENKPGISNLISIYNSLTGTPINEIEKEFENKNYGEFKKKVADIVVKELGAINKKYNEILYSQELETILNRGAEITRKIAKAKYEEMKIKMGLTR